MIVARSETRLDWEVEISKRAVVPLGRGVGDRPKTSACRPRLPCLWHPSQGAFSLRRKPALQAVPPELRHIGPQRRKMHLCQAVSINARVTRTPARHIDECLDRHQSHLRDHGSQISGYTPRQSQVFLERRTVGWRLARTLELTSSRFVVKVPSALCVE